VVHKAGFIKAGFIIAGSIYWRSQLQRLCASAMVLPVRLTLMSGDCFTFTLDPRPRSVNDLKSRLRDHLLAFDSEGLGAQAIRCLEVSVQPVARWRLLRNRHRDSVESEDSWNAAELDDKELACCGSISFATTTRSTLYPDYAECRMKHYEHNCSIGDAKRDGMDTERLLDLSLVLVQTLTSLNSGWFENLGTQISSLWVQSPRKDTNHCLFLCGATHDSLPVDRLPVAAAHEVFFLLRTAACFVIPDPHNLGIANALGVHEDQVQPSDATSEDSESEEDMGVLDDALQNGRRLTLDGLDADEAVKFIAEAARTCSVRMRSRKVNIDAEIPQLVQTEASAHNLAREFIFGLGSAGDKRDTSMVLFHTETHTFCLRLGLSGGLCWYHRQACFMMAIYVEPY